MSSRDLAAAASIQRSAALPYYAQLANILRDEIVAGRWAPGELIPSEADLGSFFGLSRTVVRQALDVLSQEGLVRKEKGKGTFVTRTAKAEFVVQELRGFHEEMTQRGRAVETRVLRTTTLPVPPEFAGHLEVAVGSEVVVIERVRRVDGERVVHVLTYLPSPRFASLLDADLSRRSLYGTLREDFGVEPNGGVRSIEAVAADRAIARHLGVRSGDPVLRLDAINLDGDGRPFEFFRAHYRGDLTTFQIWLEAKEARR